MLKIIVRWIVCSIFMVISTNASANKSLAWEIEFGWRSNWVANDIYIISSIGTITIKKFSPFREKICKVKLANQELTDINYSINAIPKSLPYGTKIKYMDNCNDEKENYIYITQGDVKRGFVFTRLKECRLTKVPFWLDNLYEELDHIMIRMDNCR